MKYKYSLHVFNLTVCNLLHKFSHVNDKMTKISWCGKKKQDIEIQLSSETEV